MTAVVGLDLSLTSTGIALADGTTIAVKVRSKGTQRLRDIETRVLEACFAGGVSPELVVLEGYAFNARSHAHALGELGGVVKLALADHSLPVAICPPTSRAKMATGRGNSAKSAVVSAWSVRTGVAYSTDDECDAAILRAMGLAHLGCPELELPKLNLTSLDGVEWPIVVTEGTRRGRSKA